MYRQPMRCRHGCGGMLSGWKFSNFKDGVFGEYFHVNEADAGNSK